MNNVSYTNFNITSIIATQGTTFTTTLVTWSTAPDLTTTRTTTLSKFLYSNIAGAFSATSYNATSDYRIKENVEPLDSHFTVDNLRPVHYDNISSKQHAIGFIAHEVQEHYPFLVDGEKDGDKTQSLNYNGLIGILVNEIQLLKKTVQEMKTKIDSLEK